MGGSASVKQAQVDGLTCGAAKHHCVATSVKPQRRKHILAPAAGAHHDRPGHVDRENIGEWTGGGVAVQMVRFVVQLSAS